MTSLPPRSASLAPFFTPNGVAIIGASRDPSKLSYGVVRNLVDPERGYPGPIYPVNPKADEILGLKCYPDIAAVPDPVELAVLILPAGHGGRRNRGVRPARHQGGGGHLRRLPRGRPRGRGARGRDGGDRAALRHADHGTERHRRDRHAHAAQHDLCQGHAAQGTHRVPVAIGRAVRRHHRLDHRPRHRFQPLPQRRQRGRRQRDRRDPLPGRGRGQPGHHPLSGGRQGRAGVRGRAARRGRPQAGAGAQERAGPPAARRPPPRTPARWPASTPRSAPPASRPA